MRVQASQLFDHLPYLRRYARALTGATQHGDDLVLRAVEAAMLAPERFGLAAGARPPLYALLNLLFDEDAGGSGHPVLSPYPIERALAALPETERRVYLLMVLERLSPSETAATLNLPPGVVDHALSSARRALRQALSQRVMVVEDNALLAMELEVVVASLGHEICGTATSEHSALQLADRSEPTLALLDVCLGNGGSGVSVARRLRDRGISHTIFVTGHAEEIKSSDARHLGPVVAKPYSQAAIDGAIQRAIFMPSPVAVA